MFDEVTLNANSPHRSSWAQVAIDLVLLTEIEGRLHLVIVNRDKPPFEGYMVLPGARILLPQPLDEAAYEVLFDQIGPIEVKLEQFQIFGAPERDPRRWTIAVAYLGLVPLHFLEAFVGLNQPACLAEIVVEDEVGCALLRYEGDFISLGFDHADIVHAAICCLRAGGDASMWPFRLLAHEFTLLELQRAHEAIADRKLNKPLFRKQVLKRIFADGSRLALSGSSRRGRHRPARYYHLVRP